MQLSYRQQTALSGAIIGAVAGAVLALMYASRALPEDEAGAHTSVKFSDLTRIAVALGAVVRQINALADEGETAS